MNIKIIGDEISYDVVETRSITMSAEEREFVGYVVSVNRTLKIPAIKYLRAKYGLPLKAAKEIVEALEKPPNVSLGQLLRDKMDGYAINA